MYLIIKIKWTLKSKVMELKALCLERLTNSTDTKFEKFYMTQKHKTLTLSAVMFIQLVLER